MHCKWVYVMHKWLLRWRCRIHGLDITERDRKRDREREKTRSFFHQTYIICFFPSVQLNAVTFSIESNEKEKTCKICKVEKSNCSHYLINFGKQKATSHSIIWWQLFGAAQSLYKSIWCHFIPFLKQTSKFRLEHNIVEKRRLLKMCLQQRINSAN